MVRILISGYYGFNNIGDESILKAVVDNLQEQLSNIEITVLSKNPESTTEKYGVKAADRKFLPAVLSAVSRCDLLISGGGSLLQDVTSKKSILYYLFIIRAALFFGKKVLIYSQGIGPITSKFNRRLTAKTLRKVSGIVVRDETSREFLAEIGVPADRVVVTADPVLRIKPVSKERGAQILENEGFVALEGKRRVGFAVRERKMDSAFVDELCIAMDRLTREFDAQVVLIPFHYSEDMAFLEEAERRLGDKVFAIRHKYLTEEMLSIIGNMDVLVGVRLHALIHAAIMDVAMIGISYDPKVNSFLHSVGMKALCSIYDFNHEFFLEEFGKIAEQGETVRARVQENLKELVERLDTNEEMIRDLMGMTKK